MNSIKKRGKVAQEGGKERKRRRLSANKACECTNEITHSRVNRYAYKISFIIDISFSSRVNLTRMQIRINP